MSAIALIPAYNAGRTIAEVVARIPRAHVQEIAVVDDGSADDTFDVIASLGGSVTPLRHDRNRGYGGAQKTLYRYAKGTAHDLFINLCADGGHLPEEIPCLLEPFADDRCRAVLGSRTMGVIRAATPLFGSRTLGACLGRGGMPAHIFTFHQILGFLQNAAHGARYHSWHSGFRVVHRAVLEEVPFDRLTDWYEYDTEFLIWMNRRRIPYREVAVSVCYREDAGTSVPLFRYGMRILKSTFRRGADRIDGFPGGESEPGTNGRKGG